MRTVAAILLALVLIPVGASKLTGRSAARWRDRFMHWGLPAGAAAAVGALEVACGVAVLVPRTRRYAATAIAVIMLGALATHAVHGELPRVVMPLVLCAIGVFVATRPSGNSAHPEMTSS